MAEDRERFRDLLDRIGQPYAPSAIVEGATDADRRVVGRRGARRDRPAGDRPAGVHARRHRRRHRRDRGGLPRADPGRPPRQPDRPGDGREVPRRLAGDRVRGDARRRRHVHRGLLDGERRPARRPHRRLDRRRAGPDAAGPGPPAAPERRPRDHPGARRRGRLQRPVRALAGLDRVRGHRGQPAGLPQRRPSRARRPATRSPGSRPRSRSGGRSPRSRTSSPARPSPRSSRPSTTSSSSCRASRSTSSRPPTGRSAAR